MKCARKLIIIFVSGGTAIILLFVLWLDRLNYLSPKTSPSEREITEQRAFELGKYCLIFRSRYYVFPASLHDLSKYVGPIKSEMLCDGWGRTFLLYTNIEGGLMIVSLGADGKPGGNGTNG